MKRFMTILGLVVGLGFSTPTLASAITCQPYAAGSSYPVANIQYCTNVTQTQAAPVDNALSAAPGQSTITSVNGVNQSLITYMQGLHKTNSAEGIFYVFNNDTDFETWAGDTTNPNSFKSKGVPYPTLASLRTPGGISGDTLLLTNGTTNFMAYTLLFMNIDFNGKYVPNKVVGNTAAHELGHWMNFLFAATAGQATANGASASSYFKMEVGADWASFAAFPSCPGIFSYHADNTGLLPGATGPYYICAGATGTGKGYNPKYANSASNKATLGTAWSYIYNGTIDELFAEVYGGGSKVAGQNDLANAPSARDPYLGYNYSSNSFQCSQAFVNYLIKNNAIPKSANPPANWPTGCPLF